MNLNRPSIRNLKTCAVILTAAAAAMAHCQKPGDLVVSPTRVLLDDRAKSSDITLLNRGAQTVRYRLTLVDMEMSEDGILRRVAPGSDHSALNVLRLSPREIVLEPGVSQRIKIAALFPAGLTDGELRSHLAFEPIAAPKPKSQQAGGDGAALRINLELRSVVTIPVIARHGRVAATATISDPSILKTKDGWVAQFKLERTGNRSIRGDVIVSFVPADGGTKTVLGLISSLPVYVPNADRIVTVRLERELANLGKGQIEIRFSEPDRSRGAAAAKAVVALPK